MTNSTLAVSTAQEKKIKVLDVQPCWQCGSPTMFGDRLACQVCNWRATIDRMWEQADKHAKGQIDEEELIVPENPTF